MNDTPDSPHSNKDPDVADPARMVRTLDDALDFELEQTFPASDPLSLTRAAPSAAPRVAKSASGKMPRPADG